MPPKLTKTNWEAIGAVAGVVGVLLALRTPTVPGGSTPNPHPVPSNSWVSTLPTPPPGPRNPPAAAPSQAPFPTSNQPGGEPPGCQQGKATVTTYHETVGPGIYSEANAAQRAASGIQGAMGSGANGTVLTDLQILGQDFVHLRGVAGTPEYNTVAATTTTDSQQLWKDCGTG